jgi:hypothetical protein
MDKPLKELLFSTIRSSGILTFHAEQDANLADMLETPAHPDIYYFDSFAIASQLTPIFQKRLAMMVAKNIQHNFESIQQLVAFTEEHPDSLIYNVAFNCPDKHYGVRCGLLENDLQAICVILGAHLSEDMPGESFQ